MLFRYCDEALASLCKCADPPEPSLPAYEILILIALSSDYTCANVQTQQSLSCWREQHINRNLRQHMIFWYSDEG